MKKFLLFALALLRLTGCAGKRDTVTFIGTIEEVYDNGFLVTTTDDVGFDRASIGFDKDMKNLSPTSNFFVGQSWKITILPVICESYPVQVPAVGIDVKHREPT